ncbi:MAG: HU family DNA-binding protein [Gammaproteobacteria bacterium]
MNKADLIDAIHGRHDTLTKKDVAAVIESLFDEVTHTVARGDEISLIGFGKFHATQRAARTGRNPATGEELQIAASTVPKFTAGKAFKDAVSKKTQGKKK